MTTPNFFIVGAPKCGTTALYTYLAEHLNVFMPALKEPHFFSSDLREYTHITEQQAYLRLFEPAGVGHRAVGEASVWYLYSAEAVPRIRRFNPEARLIVMVRRPVEMFLSLHGQMLATARESVRDPERAWALQPDRARGDHLPRLCEQPRLLQYGAICRLGEQLERLRETFPADQVLVIEFDEFAGNPGIEYRRTLEFLGLPDDGRKHFPRINVAHRMRWPRMGAWHRYVDRELRMNPRWRVVRRLAGPLRGGARTFKRANLKYVPRSKISAAFETTLVENFSRDIDRLARLVDRDLSHWKEARVDG